MDDEYELISKVKVKEKDKEIKNLKKETKKAKEKAGPTLKKNDKVVSDIILAVQNEGKEERAMILKTLNELKDLNKSTLDNVLNKTTELDNKLIGVTEAMGELTTSITKLIEHLQNNKPDESYNAKIEEIKSSIENLPSVQLSSQELDAELIINKLDEVETFMKDLKTLLGQVKNIEM